jgi:hypothetical protein
MKKKKSTQKPLTLDELASYNQEVLFPAMEARFVTKTEFKALKTEFKDFKNESLTNQDKMLKKLDILLTEKKVREYQEEKQKKLWAIIIKALKEHRILSPQELEEIARLEIF